MASDLRIFASELDPDEVGRSIYRIIEDLFPINRSITGEGLRTTFRYLKREIPLELVEVPTGTKVLDWTVPREWNIADAYVKDSTGRKVIDLARSHLHVLNYSTPIRARMSLAELDPHLHSLPARPDSVPYRTSYYDDSWGFCLSHADRLALDPDETYDVCIDSALTEGHLTYAEYVIPGGSDDEVLLSAHACHPAQCNDNLSGVAIAAWLGKHFGELSLRYSYRFLFAPGTIGAITWLARNRTTVDRIKHGLVLTCLGDRGSVTYKRSRRGDAEIDRAVCHTLEHAQVGFAVQEFSPDGYDERQYCSPAFNLPVGCLMRTPWGQFPEYHTSADNLAFVDSAALADSVFTILATLAALEENRSYLNQNPAGEPQLGRRGLYRKIGGGSEEVVDEQAVLWMLNLSDGHHSLLDIAERSKLPFAQLTRATDALVECELLRETPALSR